MRVVRVAALAFSVNELVAVDALMALALSVSKVTKELEVSQVTPATSSKRVPSSKSRRVAAARSVPASAPKV